MPVSVQIGLLLALATSLAAIVGFLYKHRGAVEGPDVDWRRPVYSTFILFKSPAYTAGVLIAIVGWGFHVGALALAPISLVQATIAGSLVMLTAIADRFFGHQVTRREWIGVGLAALGLAFLAATLEGTGDEAHSDYDTLTLWVFTLAVFGVGVCAGIAGAREGRRAGPLFAASAGLLWGSSDTAIKASSDAFGEESVAAIFIHPLVALIIVASFAGLLVSARSLQIGPAVPVIAITSVAANVSTIVSGPIVFGEPMPDDTLGLTVRIAAFVLVVGAAALTPPPLSLEDELPVTGEHPEVGDPAEEPA